MTHVVTESCIRCRYTDCVDVCPVDCFREGPNFLTIDPDECIDCAVCVAECPVNAIYDRAALVALPKEMRDRYTEHLVQIAENAPQLVIAYEYDQSVVNGPPFSVSQDEVRRHYTDSYNLTLLATADVPGGLKGKCSATEHVWLLKNG